MSPYLQNSSVEAGFGGLKALNDCGFMTQQGRITCLVGPNNAGKTTVFNVITGFHRPKAGLVSFKSPNLDSLKPSSLPALRARSDLRLFIDLTVIDNVLTSFGYRQGRNLWLRSSAFLRRCRATAKA